MPKRSRSQRGGEKGGLGLPPRSVSDPLTGGEEVQTGGHLPALSPSDYHTPGGYAKSQYYTISGGGRKKRRGSSKKRHGGKKRGSKKRSYKGGDGVLAAAAVPFGLLALQRYFKGSKTSKQGMEKMGRSFKRTFRRRH